MIHLEDWPPSDLSKRIALSGRKLAGKNFIAEQAGYSIFGFADPMYALAEYYLGSSDKSLPGVRHFLRMVGA